MPIAKGVLQPAPPGLLSMLELKQRGANPDTLGDLVVPTVDLTHWYQADVPTVNSGLVSLVSTVVYANVLQFNSPAALEVPANEIWWVRALTVWLDLDPVTATAVNLQVLAPAWRTRQQSSQNLGGFRIGRSHQAITTLGAAGRAYYAPTMYDFWAPPGSLFSAFIVGSATDPTNTINIAGTVTANRFLV